MPQQTKKENPHTTPPHLPYMTTFVVHCVLSRQALCARHQVQPCSLRSSPPATDSRPA
jgi:hypothetical protein